MRPRMGWFGQSLVVLTLFAIGTGAGFGWKQGWFPVELLPPESGRLSTNDGADAGSDEIPSTRATPLADEAAEPDADLAIFQNQSEPEPESEIGRTSTPSSRAGVASTRPLESQFVPPAPGVDEDVLIAATPPQSEVQRAGLEVDEDGIAKPQTVTAAAETDDAEASTGKSWREQLADIDRKIDAGEVLAAHKQLSQIYWNHRSARPEIEGRLDELARQIFFEPQPHFVEPYTFASGDRLQTVAAKYKLSWEYVAKLNRTNPKRIQAGQRLKVLRGPFGALVELSDYTLTVHLQGYYVKRYQVGIGKDGSSPIGKFPVLNKVVNPQYTDPDGKVIAGDDPSNPLGERWIDLGDSYGIHGTIEPESLGKAASRGCIRMGDEDVIEVYDFLINGSEVAIRK